MSVLFVETSALLRVLFQEPGFELMRDRLSGGTRLVASRLIKIEAERAILRACRAQRDQAESLRIELQADLQMIWPRFDFIEMTREVCDSAGRVAPELNLRSLDAIHLATYYWIKSRAPETEMMSFDERILGAVGAAR